MPNQAQVKNGGSSAPNFAFLTNIFWQEVRLLSDKEKSRVPPPPFCHDSTDDIILIPSSWSQHWLLQRLEDEVLHDANGMYVKDAAAAEADDQLPASSSSAVKISARVRDIISRNLASPSQSERWTPATAADMPTVDQLKEENRVLEVSSNGRFQYFEDACKAR